MNALCDQFINKCQCVDADSFELRFNKNLKKNVKTLSSNINVNVHVIMNNIMI